VRGIETFLRPVEAARLRKVNAQGRAFSKKGGPESRGRRPRLVGQFPFHTTTGAKGN
jgi:hypothetical protein